MRRKIEYLFIMAVVSATAFLIGATTKTEATTEAVIPEGYIPMETAIPTSDIAEWHVNANGYLEVTLKDVAYQEGNENNASYTDVLMHVPHMISRENNTLNLNSVSGYDTNENELTIYTSDGNEYVIEK